MEEINQESNESIIKKLNRYREEGSKYRKQFEESWDEQEQFYEGVHFKYRDPTNRPRNFTFQIVESEVPLLTDPMISTDIIAVDEDAADIAPVLQAAKDHVLRKQNAQHKDTVAIRSMLKVGQGIEYIGYDPDGEAGEGEIQIKNMTWGQVIVDPSAEDIDQCRYAIIDCPLSNEELKKKYPKTAEEALSQPIKDVFMFSNNKFAREDRNNGSNATGYTQSRYDSKDMTYIEECYIKDFEMVAIPDEETQLEITKESAELMNGINPDIHKYEDHEKHIEGHQEQKIAIGLEVLARLGQPQDPSLLTPEFFEEIKQDPEVGLLFNIIDDHISMHQMMIESIPADQVNKKPKYKNNLRLIVKTGDVVHYDGEPDCEDGMIPLVFFYCYKNEKIYADGVLKNLIPMQKTINELDQKELKGLKLNTNAGWVVDNQSGVDPDTLTDEEGIVVTKEQGTEVQRLQAGSVSPQLEGRVRREFESMQRIEGVGETMLGEAPKHALAMTSLRRLQMQSLGRIRLKTRMIENAIQRRDKLILSRIIKFWSTERKLRAEDNSGKIKFIKFDPKMMKDFTYDLVISNGSMAGMDNETIYETYKELLLAQAIDLKTFLQAVAIPKKQAILDYLEQQDQVKASMEQLQAENLQLKAQFLPQALTPEEQQLIASQQPQ